MDLVPRVLAALLLVATSAAAQLSTRSVETFGQVSSSADSVRVPIDAPVQPADVGAGAFTIEQWLRCTDGDNEPIVGDHRGTDSQTSAFDWINGRIFLDRDIVGNPSAGGGDWGASLHRPSAASTASVVRWGAQNSSGTSLTIQGSTDVCDDTWHHVAVGRNGASQLFIVVDGVTDFTGTDTIGGSLAFPDGTGSGEDRFLVWGNEKHAFQPGYRGHLDELRVWSVARTAQQLSNDRFTVLAANTSGLELYLRLEEGAGQALVDATGKNDGALFFAGAWRTSVPPGGGTTSTSSSTTTTSSSSTSTTSSPGGPSTSTSTSSTLHPGGPTSTTSSTTASAPAVSTTSTSVPQRCAGAEDCDDLDPCTADECITGACRQAVSLGVAGATCELRRFADAPLCPANPPRAKVARSITRRLGTAARLLEAADAAGLERPRGRRKMNTALRKLDGAEGGIRRATEQGRLADECADPILIGLDRARAALLPAGDLRRDR